MMIKDTEQTTMKLLLVDIGNTTADFRFYDSASAELVPLFRPLSQDTQLQDGTQLLQQLSKFPYAFEAIVYVSVVPHINESIRELGNLLDIPVYSLRQDLPVEWDRFKLKNVHLLGADFIANFYGVERQYHFENCAVIALGTATTIFIIQNGNFIGTTISPGIKTSLNGLFAQAALLSEMEYQYLDQPLGFDTFESMSIGTINGHYYMIEGLIAKMREHYRIDQLLFTGGNAHYYMDEVKDSYHYDENLIFYGLINLAEKSLLAKKSA